MTDPTDERGQAGAPAPDARRCECHPPAGLLHRRSLLRLGFSALAAAGVGALAATLRFFFPRALLEESTAFGAGLASEYAVGAVNERFLRSRRVWIVRDQKALYVLLARCTHLGCTPAWREAEGVFRCPCHGSVFTREGLPVEGPAPRPLERVAVEITDEGRLVVDTGVLLRRELGQWDDPRSQVKVG